MSKKTVISVFFFLTSLFIYDVHADDINKIKRVQDDVRKASSAVYNNDVETSLSFTHKKIIEMMGGYETAKKLTSEALVKFAAIGITRESLDFPSRPKFFKSEINEFAFVPTLSVISSNGQKFESLNYQLGIRNLNSEDWKYVEGSRLNKQNVTQIFPDFPTDVEFPQIYRKKL
jgi:hypothetical protein